MLIHVYKTMPASRPADLCLEIDGCCIFADFNRDGDRLMLVRISFDGFGCCETPAARPMSEEDTRVIWSFVDGRASNDDCDAALRRYFAAHQDLIWPEALARYELT